MDLLECRTCNVALPTSAFTPSSASSPYPRCRTCYNTAAGMRRRANPQRGKDTFWVRYGVAKHAATSRGLAFDLDPLEYRALWGRPCHYCGAVIDLVGIDRVDNAVGYTVANTVLCCWVCNSWKMTFTMEEWRAHLTRLYRVLVLGEAVPDDGYRTPPPFRSRRTTQNDA